ncbi:MAG: DUF4870 domain-containing protein [Patescibacteria group bacterium]|nr:DUF4870 domain-containing protein [Patescibacteria group bacterium]
MAEEKKEEKKVSGSDVEENKVWAAIGYLGILFLIPMLAKKDSPFAQYHAKQGLALFILGVIVGAASALPIIGWFVIAPIGSIVTLILFIIGLVNSLSGKTVPLPIIGKMAENVKL